jgi:hypothetical protein
MSNSAFPVFRLSRPVLTSTGLSPKSLILLRVRSGSCIRSGFPLGFVASIPRPARAVSEFRLAASFGPFRRLAALEISSVSLGAFRGDKWKLSWKAESFQRNLCPEACG